MTGAVAGGVPRPPVTHDDTPLEPPDPAAQLSEADPTSSFVPPVDSTDAPSASSGMGQNASSQQQLDRLQEQLQAHLQLERDAAQTSEPVEEDEDAALFFAARKRGRSADPSASSAECSRSGSQSSSRRGRPRPMSSFLPATSWAGQFSQLALAPRKSTAPASSVTNHATPPRPAGGAAERDVTGPEPHASSAGPTRSRSISADSPLGRVPPSRTSRTSPAASFRHSLRLPFLPSIPASPLPPILSPGLTRCASSPPVLPAIATGGPLTPSFTLAPPTGSLSPAGSWPGAAPDDSTASPAASAPAPAPLLYRVPTSASAPNLSLAATAPVSDPSSYFASPVGTAASSPVAVTAPLPLSSALGLTSGSDELLDLLEYDPELLVADVAVAAAEAKEQADAAQLDDRRYHALVELVETERGYLEHLRVLVKVYFQTLPFLTALTVPEVQAVVRNANELLALHERIGERVDQVERELLWRQDGEGAEGETREDWASKTRRAAGRVARIFSDEMPNFELYNNFCSRHAEALDITRSISSRPEWEAFERQCAAHVASDAGRGDRTPVAAGSMASSSFFPPLSAPPSHGSPLPFSATPLATPSHSSGTVATQASLAASAASSASQSTSRSRLRFVDYAIAPVQRVTRYPLVFGQLAKYFTGTTEHDALNTAWTGFKAVAQGVDAAKRAREGEMRTKVVARRMEFNAPFVGGTFCDILGPTLLVGALHVVRSGPAQAQALPGATGEVLKVKYFGCFLYRSHLVMAKIKKRASYEPREWLPLRLFEIESVEDGQGLLSHSIRLTFRDHHFELGALCDGERAVWLSHLLAAQAAARHAWSTQELDEHGKATMFDDSVVSSVPTGASAPQRKSHSRSASSVSVVSTFGGSSNGHMSSPVLAQEEPVPPVPSEFVEIAKASTPASATSILSTSAPLTQIASPSTSTLALTTTPTLASRSRFTSTASSILLGRTPASQRAAVDLRLADVFSAECLSARAQAAREVELETAASLASRRFRTMSGPKRSMTALAPGTATSPPFSQKSLPSASTSSVRDRRRMSSFEVGLALSDRAEFRGALGLDAAQTALYHTGNGKASALGFTSLMPMPEKDRARSWANAIRKAGHKTGAHGSVSSARSRPDLPEIDTALAEQVSRATAANKRGSVPPLSAGGSWSWRGHDRDGGLGGQLRRVASHSSIDATPSGPPTSLPTMLVLPDTPTVVQGATMAKSVTPAAGAINNSAADVERNNSVSSTTSSSGTGTQSSSSHAHSLQVLDTPPSSIPPSPDFGTVELADALFPPPGKPTFATSPPTPQHGTTVSPRWSTVSDGVSNVFRLRRRKSTLGLVPPAFPSRSSPSTSDENLTARSPTLDPSDTALSNAAVKLQRRASTTISGLFSSKKRAQSSPSLAGPGGYFGGSNSSTPHLSLRRSPSNSPGSSALSTPDQVPTTPEAPASTELAPPPELVSSAPTLAPMPPPAATTTRKRGVPSGNKGPMLLRTRTRFLFASHNGMTPMS